MRSKACKEVVLPHQRLDLLLVAPFVQTPGQRMPCLPQSVSAQNEDVWFYRDAVTRLAIEEGIGKGK
jgi:hypothetical protein